MSAACDHILRFQPIFRRYLWGGRRLGTALGKPIGPEDDYAESWELVDHGADQSVVRFGPLAGTTLGELVKHHAVELFGDRGAPPSSFPLLMKLLDCNRTLSVQVHPNDEQAAKLTPPDLGKTESWVVLAAEPGSKIYAGLKPGVTREKLAAALAAGRCETTLHEFEPRVGDCVFIPAGTIHALGAGLLIAEIQQASDTTFRLFDWNRVDAEGKPRALHIEQSLATIDYDRGPVGPQKVQSISVAKNGQLRERVVVCDKFVLDRITFDKRTSIGGDGRFHVLCVAEGSARAANDPADQPLARGDVALAPAAAGAIELVPYGKTILLDISLP
jgi:mannose-6-phosphate isomerase